MLSSRPFPPPPELGLEELWEKSDTFIANLSRRLCRAQAHNGPIRPPNLPSDPRRVKNKPADATPREPLRNSSPLLINLSQPLVNTRPPVAEPPPLQNPDTQPDIYSDLEYELFGPDAFADDFLTLLNPEPVNVEPVKTEKQIKPQRAIELYQKGKENSAR